MGHVFRQRGLHVSSNVMFLIRQLIPVSPSRDAQMHTLLRI